MYRYDYPSLPDACNYPPCDWPPAAESAHCRPPNPRLLCTATKHHSIPSSSSSSLFVAAGWLFLTCLALCFCLLSALPSAIAFGPSPLTFPSSPRIPPAHHHVCSSDDFSPLRLLAATLPPRRFCSFLCDGGGPEPGKLMRSMFLETCLEDPV